MFKGKEEKVIISPIKRAINPNVQDPEHENYFLFGTGSRDYVLPMDRQGNLINPFSSDEEKQWLEKTLDVDLNFYKKTDNFWHRFKVSLGKSQRTLDLTNPQDYLDYLVLNSNKHLFAPVGTKTTDYLQSQRYALIKTEDVVAENAKRVNLKNEAYKAFGKMEDNKEEMVNFLKIYGQVTVNQDRKKTKVTLNTKRELLVELIDEIIEKDINGFLNIIRNKDNYEITLLISNALEVGAITKEQRKYFLPGGDPMCAEGLTPTIDNAVLFLKNPKNQEIKLMLDARVKAAKE